MNVLILAPEIDLPFKRPPLVRRGVSQETKDIRIWWHRFAYRIAGAFKYHGHKSRVLQIPNWEITPDLVNAYAPDLAFIPHRQISQFQGCEVPCLFYMQMYARWLFTVDPQGWGAGSSVYPVDYSAGDPDSDAFDRTREQVLAQSKFDQTKEVAPSLPERYIFFPCQIPHDQNVVHHADVQEVDLVGALAEWCNKSGVHVVFKPHPANPASMEPLKESAPESAYIHWIDTNIHTLIANSTAVYTINSGVGFEAILHGKPVVTFGRSEYDVVSYRQMGAHGPWFPRLETISANHDYCRFIDWFVRHYAVDLSDEERFSECFDRLVRQAEATAFLREAA